MRAHLVDSVICQQALMMAAISSVDGVCGYSAAIRTPSASGNPGTAARKAASALET